MAKKKAVKKKTKPRHHPDYDPELGCGAKKKIIRLRVIVDDDVGWVECPFDVAMQCGVYKRNPRRGDFIYVPGEDNGTILESRLEDLGLTPKYKQYWVPKLRAWLKGEQWPNALAWRGGEWPEGSVWRNYKEMA